jgi:hypothetical protein
MNVKKTAVFLLTAVLVTGYSFGLSNDDTKTRADENINGLLKKLEKVGETPERVDILKDLSREYIRINPEKALSYATQGCN